eukprot:1036455-Lingulodinium_polyedra.AAC.1
MAHVQVRALLRAPRRHVALRLRDRTAILARRPNECRGRALMMHILASSETKCARLDVLPGDHAILAHLLVPVHPNDKCL